MARRPGLMYVVTAAALSCICVALVTYPILFTLPTPNRTGPVVVALSIAVVVAAALTWYSWLPKPRLLLKLNVLVIPLVCGLALGVAYALRPRAVGTGAMWLVTVSLMTFMAPVWLFACAWIAHAITCFHFFDMGRPFDPPGPPSGPGPTA